MPTRDPTAAEAPVRERAPAKVNLDLRVVGRRGDGYHELDSLVVFGPVADELAVLPDEDLRLEVEGPFAALVPAGEANLVLRAARTLVDACGVRAGARLVLRKEIPPQSGLGGGASDAAAALRGLVRLWRLDVEQGLLWDLAREVGADVPVCLYGRPARIRGIGERIDPVRGLPELPLLVAWPGRGLSTAAVYARLRRKDHGTPRRPPLPARPTLPVFLAWLEASANDLEASARALLPAVGELLGRLALLPGCRLARMTGSGSACFALFSRPEEAEAARARLSAEHPDWWVVSGTVCGEP